RRTFEGLLDPRARLRIARQLGADLEHLVAKAMAGAQQQHRLLLELERLHGLPASPGVAMRYRDGEGLVVEGLRHEALVGKRLGEDGDVDLALAQQLEQLDGEVLL